MSREMAKISYLMVVVLVVGDMMVDPGESLKCSETRPVETLCSSYTRGQQAEPTGECCSAVREIRGVTNTTETRRQLCNCTHQNAAKNIPEFQITRFNDLPIKCGLHVIYSVDPRFDCTTVN